MKIASTSLKGKQLPFGFAKRHRVLLLPGDANYEEMFCVDNPSIALLSEVRRFAFQPIRANIISAQEFESRLSMAYQQDTDEAMGMVADIGDGLDLAYLAHQAPEMRDLLESGDDAPIIKLINAILAEAIKQQASDIHIEVFEKRLVVRFRIDGILRDIVEPKHVLAPLLISRIKVMAKLDIAEKRLPQDGRTSLQIAGHNFDVRVSTIPTSYGERIVLRLLDKQSSGLELEKLGMCEHDRAKLTRLLHLSHGIILVTGPTGSGKTTTLYAGLEITNDRKKNILTIEDPVEYDLEGVGQTQINSKAGMTFPTGLRAILRQDPDIVMVGEIRDLETMQVAVQASLTGHLVLSTLHTNTAVGAVVRLIDMGVEPFLLASSLAGLLAQRLVRLLCEHCKVAYQPDQLERDFLNIENGALATLYKCSDAGCEDCQYTGYKGRTGIYELVVMDETLRKLVHDGESEASLARHARQVGPSITDDGRKKIVNGLTSLEEVLRVTQDQ